MGTNYYHVSEPCEYCGRSDMSLHIGKSSAGWCFALHVYPESGPENLQDWIERWLKGGSIKDGGDKDVSLEDMLRVIMIRSMKYPLTGDIARHRGHCNLADFYHVNYAQPGPNNLLRHKIEGNCIDHGDGTWDLMTGDFS